VNVASNSYSECPWMIHFSPLGEGPSAKDPGTVDCVGRVGISGRALGRGQGRKMSWEKL
jgi:hypothetical protein